MDQNRRHFLKKLRVPFMRKKDPLKDSVSHSSCGTSCSGFAGPGPADTVTIDGRKRRSPSLKPFLNS